MDRKIRMVLLDNLTPEDLLKLKLGGFFDGVAMPMPGEAKGKEATLKVKDEPVVFPPVAAVPVTQDATPAVTEQKPAKAKKAKVEEPQPEPVPTPAEVIQQTKEVEAAEPPPASVGDVPVSDLDIDIAKLASLTKLRDILQYALDCGIPAEGMSEFCEGIKNEVPLLTRIPNIADRVQRTLEVMGS